jgi:flagellar motor switch protein FliM
MGSENNKNIGGAGTMGEKTQVKYRRVIRLSPALGDWTQLKPETLKTELDINPVNQACFDALPMDDIRYAHYLHYRLAERITKGLCQDLNIKTELNTVEVNQISYGQFIGIHREKVVQMNLVHPSVGEVHVLIAWSLADRIVNRLTGGTGETSDAEVFSELELEILKTQFGELKSDYADIWKNTVSRNEITANFYSGPYVFDPKLSQREAFVYFVFRFFFGDGRSQEMIWAYPNRSLRSLLQLRRQVPDPIKYRVKISDRVLRAIKIPVQATLGNASLRFSDLTQLQPGDVIPLENDLSVPISVSFSPKHKTFMAQPGAHNNRLAFQLLASEESAVMPEARTSPTVEDLAQLRAQGRPQSVQSIQAPEPEPVAMLEYDENISDFGEIPDSGSPAGPEEGIEAEDQFEFEEANEVDEPMDSFEPEEANDGFSGLDETSSDNFEEESFEPVAESNSAESDSSSIDDDFSWDDLDEK